MYAEWLEGSVQSRSMELKHCPNCKCKSGLQATGVQRGRLVGWSDASIATLSHIQYTGATNQAIDETAITSVDTTELGLRQSSCTGCEFKLINCLSTGTNGKCGTRASLTCQIGKLKIYIDIVMYQCSHNQDGTIVILLYTCF